MRAFFLILAWLATTFVLKLLNLDVYAIVVDLLFLITVLASLSFHAERVAADLGVNTVYNVMVMSWVAALPQTAVAIAFAQAGKYHAAYVDSMASTLIDAMLVTAIVRRHVIRRIGAKFSWQVLLWTGVVLFFGATFNLLEYPRVAWAWFFVGAVVLPAIFAIPLTLASKPSAVQLAELATNAIATGWVAYDLGVRLAEFHMAESALGVLGAAFATAPDFLVALAIRTILARAIGEASDEDAVKTMFAAAVHDQISDPALVAILSPQSVIYFPHELNIFASLVKLTLLHPLAFWAIGVPSSVVVLILLAV